MKIIDESIIEQESAMYAQVNTDSEFWDVDQIQSMNDFKAGFLCAEQKLTPLFVEFTEWFFITTDKFTRPNLYSVVEWSDLNSSVLYTAEQLFEQFLKTKQK